METRGYGWCRGTGEGAWLAGTVVIAAVVCVLCRVKAAARRGSDLQPARGCGMCGACAIVALCLLARLWSRAAHPPGSPRPSNRAARFVRDCSSIHPSGHTVRRCGLFLHSPFPSSEIFRTFPKREELLRSLLNADLIGALGRSMKLGVQ
eukprot:350258-Chlamydomonas_euryale.AAC.1